MPAWTSIRLLAQRPLRPHPGDADTYDDVMTGIETMIKDMAQRVHQLKSVTSPRRFGGLIRLS